MLRVVTRSVTRPYELFRVGGARSGDGPKSLRKLPLATDIDTRCGWWGNCFLGLRWAKLNRTFGHSAGKKRSASVGRYSGGCANANYIGL